MRLNTRRIIVFASLFILFVNFGMFANSEEATKPYSETIRPANADTYGVDVKKLAKEADKSFYSGLESTDRLTKEAYLNEALKKYMLLLKFKQDDVIVCTQLGIIYDNLNNSSSAKQYFTRAININSTNPYANFNFAEHYFYKKSYFEALEYYLTAYRHGYKNYYELNLKLAQTYERLGDIDKAKIYYDKSLKLNPAHKWISNKIKSLNKIYYSKSDFKQ